MQRSGIDTLIGYWSSLVEDLAIRPSVFYEMVEHELAARRLNGIEVSRVLRREYGWFSARREYLRIRRRRFIFDVCGFPEGTSFAVSWWLGTREKDVLSLFAEIPLVGHLLDRAVDPTTPYRVDSDAAFQRTVHDCIGRVLAELNDERLPAIPELLPEPPINDLFD